ncbi:MAG TPA: hypothetical protein PLD10_01845 [Rhodopila sp.]|nr:hypothetical protein [Rhodopila sp.]
MPDEDSMFIWPATGAIQVIPLRSGGCNIKITFSDQGLVTAIGPGRITKIRQIPTKRIARQFEVTIRHSNDFESIYNITDLTPHAAKGDATHLGSVKRLVNRGDTLYGIVNGGYLHFQLCHAGKLIDPREFMQQANILLL